MHIGMKKLVVLAVLMVPAVMRSATPASRMPELPQQWSLVDSVLKSDTVSVGRASLVSGGSMQWLAMGDPMLDSLILLARQANPDILTAMRRIEVARQGLRSARAGYFPQIGLQAGWSRTRTAGAPPATSSAWQGELTLSWEIDVFGRVTAASRRERSRVLASRAAARATELSITSALAQAYVSLRQYQAQLAVAYSHAQSEAEIVKITEVRYETGLASKLDVAQARTVYGSTVASIPLLEYSIHAGINALAVLLGQTSARVGELLSVPRPMPAYVRLIATGVPADLLRRRPDLIEAERDIDVAAASLGVARKQYLPSLTLTGNIGTASRRVGDLFTSDSFGYSIAPTLSWTVFDGLARNAAVASARESMMIAVDSYNLAVATAYEEADNALSNYHHTLRYLEAVAATLADSEEAGRLSLDRYKQGLTDFTPVATALTDILQNRNTLIEARGRALGALIDIYRALGGGSDPASE